MQRKDDSNSLKKNIASILTLALFLSAGFLCGRISEAIVVRVVGPNKTGAFKKEPSIRFTEDVEITSALNDHKIILLPKGTEMILNNSNADDLCILIKADSLEDFEPFRYE